MEEYLKEYPGLHQYQYAPGDEVRIKTVLDHKASITQLDYIFRNRHDPDVQVVIPYKVQEDKQQRGNTGYMRTNVQLRWTVPPRQAPGVYLLESIKATTFNGETVDGAFDRNFAGYAGFAIKPESVEQPYASGWEKL